MNWNKMCSHDQEIARKLAASIGLSIDDNGVVRKAETQQANAADCPCGGTGLIQAPDGEAICRKHWPAGR